MKEVEQCPEIKKAIGILSDNINCLIKGIESVAQGLVAIIKSQTFQNLANACNKPFLTPRQYHLMLHGKKHVKAKWLNVARKRMDKIMKGDRAI